MRRKVVPNAPLKILADFPGGKLDRFPRDERESQRTLPEMQDTLYVRLAQHRVDSHAHPHTGFLATHKREAD